LVSRASLAKYEGAVNEPSLDVLLRISRYFKISVDCLLTVDIANHDLEILKNNLNMIVPIQVDHNGGDIVEIIPQDASAGYSGFYSDPEFIEALEHLYIPFLPIGDKCRAFPVKGDSMPPVIDGSYIVGKYIPSANHIKIGRRYIIVSRDEGILFKRISLV